MFALNQNLKLIEVQCAGISHQVHCLHPTLNHWCKWDNQLLMCQSNYNSILFLSPWDVAAMPKSVITTLILLACMLLYWCSELILNNLKAFNRIEPEKRRKCQIYIFELIGIPIAFVYLLYEGTFDAVFRPQKFDNMGPERSLTFLRSMCGTTFVIYMYAIEMLMNKLRWSLNLHHLSVIFTGVWFMALLDGSADLASIRCVLAMSLYPFTMSLYPSSSWLFHAISTAVYAMTRLCITITFVICYICWAMTDEIQDQMTGNTPRDYVYLMFFFIVPIATMLLNISQIQTMKALWYMPKSVFQRRNAHDKLLKDLESIYIEYESKEQGCWTMTEWTSFVSANTTCRSHELYQTLWDILLFSVHTDAETAAHSLSQAEFKHIFEPHVVDDIIKTEEERSVKQSIIDKIEKLFDVLSSSEHKQTVALDVYQHIRCLVDTQLSILDLPEELEPIHSIQTSKQCTRPITISVEQVPWPSAQVQLTPTQDIEPHAVRVLPPLDEHKEKQYPRLRLKPQAISISVAELTHMSHSEITTRYTPTYDIVIPQPSTPIWYANKSLSKNVSPVHREYTQELQDNEAPISNTMRIWFYAVLCPFLYGGTCSFYIMNQTAFNVYHLVSLLASLSSVTCVLLYVRILLFARNICYFEMQFKKTNAVNYIPNGMIMDEGRSFDSMSMISHARGTSMNKYHTLYVNLGSTTVLMGALIKLFDLEDSSWQQVFGVYLLMFAGIGGMIAANFEAYSSPTYSVRYNLAIGYLHLFGAFLYTIFGSLSFFMYCNSVSSCIALAATVLLLFAYRVNAYYRFKKDAAEQTNDNYIKRTNKRSKVNIGMELLAFIPSIVSMCTVLYQFGESHSMNMFAF
eukprot:395624_1